MHKSLFALCALALGGCASNNAPDSRPIQLPSGMQLAETVNGIAVPQALLDAVARAHNWRLDQPAQRDQALKILTDQVLMAQAAQRENLFVEAQFQADVEAARLKGVADAALIEFQNRTPITDAMLKAEYDAQIARTGKVAYDFTQLLFTNEDEAMKAQGEVLSGKPFQQVFDAWRGKAKQARAFTRVRLDQVPEELGKAIAAMQNGDTTKVPIKTEFGWHIVHLDIANPYSPPVFDQVKEGVRRNMQMKIAKERLDALKAQAKIEYAPGVAPPAAAPPAAGASPAAAPPGVGASPAPAPPGVGANPAPAVPAAEGNKG